MINIRQDLIAEELSSNDGKLFHKFHLSNRVIDNLRNKYYCHEMCEKWYYSEPDFDDELYDMYMDYKYPNGNHMFPDGTYSQEELKAAYLKVKQMYINYEPRRIEFNNWIEVFGEGIWGMSQQYVDGEAIDTLKELQRINVKHDGRFYWYKDKNEIHIYFYGRDFMDKDYWFIFKRKGAKN